MNSRVAIPSQVESDYYSDVIARCGADVTIRNEGAPRGRVTYASRAFRAGELMWREPPLIAMQDVDSRRWSMVARACGFCLRFLGPATLQFAHYAHVIHPDAAPAVDYVAQGNAIPCGFQCGELYCSEACRAAAYERSHRLLCVGPLFEKHPLVRFKRRAIECSDLFVFAAHGVCHVICDAAARGVSLDVARRPFSILHHRSWQAIAVDREDTTPAQFEAMMNDCFKLLRKGLLQVAAELQPELLPLVETGCTLELFAEFFEIFDCNIQGVGIASPLARLWARKMQAEHPLDAALPEEDKPHQTLAYQDDPDDLSTELLAQLDALAAELHALPDDDDDEEGEDEDGGNAAHSHRSAAASAAASSSAAAAPRKQFHLRDDAVIHDDDEEELADDDGHEHDDDCYDDDGGVDLIDGPFARLEGVGIFPLSATVNHSCVPNCVVTFNRDFSAYVYARRNIAAGDELFHTYVQETDPLDVRRAELKVYGFDCVCSKCVNEQREQEAQVSNK